MKEKSREKREEMILLKKLSNQKIRQANYLI